MKGFKLTSCNFCTGGMFWYVIRSSSFGASIWKCERNESVSIHFTPLFHFFWQRNKEFTRYTGLGASSMYKSLLACLSSSATAFFPLYFSLLSCQSSCHLFFVFLTGRNCVRAHVSDKSISRCVYEVWLYSVCLTLKSWCWKAHLCLSFNNAYTPCNANKYDSLFTSYCPWSRSFIDSNILKFQLSFW